MRGALVRRARDLRRPLRDPDFAAMFPRDFRRVYGGDLGKTHGAGAGRHAKRPRTHGNQKSRGYSVNSVVVLPTDACK